LVIHIFKEYWFDLYIGTIMFILIAVLIVSLNYFMSQNNLKLIFYLIYIFFGILSYIYFFFYTSTLKLSWIKLKSIINDSAYIDKVPDNTNLSMSYKFTWIKEYIYLYILFSIPFWVYIILVLFETIPYLIELYKFYLSNLNIIIKATIHLALIMLLTKIFYNNKYYLLLIIYYSSVILLICIYTDVDYYKEIYFFAYAALLICNYIKFSRVKLNKTIIIIKKFIKNKNYIKMSLWIALIFFPYLNFKNMCPVIWAIILPAAFFAKQPMVIYIFIYVLVGLFKVLFIY